MRAYYLLILAGLATALVQPALAQSKAEQKAPAGQQQDVQTAEQIVADAVRLCELVADNDRAILDALESSGWTQEVDYNVGNAPFYKELSGNFTYPGSNEAEIWGFIEDYPGLKIGYCSFTVPSPSIKFSLSSIADRNDLVGNIELDGSSVFGTWQDKGTPPTLFIHAYQNQDTFVYQITKLLNAQ